MKVQEVDELYRGGRYLKADDLAKPVVVAIESFVYEEVGSGEKGVLRFAGWERCLPLNKVNFTTMKRLFPVEDTEEWQGCLVELFVDDAVKFRDEIRPGIRIRAAPRGAKPEEESAV